MNALTRYRRLAGIWSAWRRGREILRYPPFRLWIEPTNGCNLRCVMCPNSLPDRPPTAVMEMDLYRSLLDQVRGTVYDANLHHRGEPLLHPRLPEMIGLAREAGISTRLHTNATLLDAERGKALLEAGLDLISFSFDGFTPEAYAAIRRGADFDATLANIEGFLALKRERGGGRPVTIFETIGFPEVTVAGQMAAREALRDRLVGRGLDKFIVKAPHNWGGTLPGGEASAAGRFTPCTFPWFALVVLADGTVAPCPQDFYGKLAVGDLNRQTVAEIWNGEPLRALRRRMAARDVTGLDPCAACDQIRRPTFLGVPTPNLRTFAKETLGGYRLLPGLLGKKEGRGL
jgi:radical SAM protein with 4Fe4S-binding SPASM domain